ncbi:hypothetical protein BSKO_00601 [Bryopsis sp. KO-2023]|nr:hypothetical protein BSKO_00601 [Bryopsis sp. KO-2023]
MASLRRVNVWVGNRHNSCSSHKLPPGGRGIKCTRAPWDVVQGKRLPRARCQSRPNEGIQKADSVSKQCIESLLANEVDALMEFVPDDVCEICLREKEKFVGAVLPTESLDFRDVIKFKDAGKFKLDSFATRLLSTDVLSEIQVLSSMLLDGNRFVQRWQVEGSRGEEAILTVTFGLHDTVIPAYRGVHVSKCWMIEEVAGEIPEIDVEIPTPDAKWPPELIVEWQLDALRNGNFFGVYNFASPQIRTSFGSPEKFGAMLQSDTYSPLLFHEDRKIVSSKTVDGGALVQCVSVQASGSSKWHTFAWLVCREEKGEFYNCWMTNGVLHQPFGRS